MDNWDISLDIEGEQPSNIGEAYDLILSANVPLPKVKYNALSVNGMQGELDLTNAYSGDLCYEARSVTLFVISKPGAEDSAESINAFIDLFLGKRIRLYNLTRSYLLIGRLVEANVQQTDTGESYKLTCTMMAEPFRYAITEQTLNQYLPKGTPANEWETSTTGQQFATANGITIPAEASITNGTSFDIDGLDTTGSYFYRLKIYNMSNCSIKVFNTSSTVLNSLNVDYSLPFVPKYDRLHIDVDVKDALKQASASVHFSKYTATTLQNNGRPVPLKVKNTVHIGTGPEDVTDEGFYIVVNGSGAKLQSLSSDFVEYPQIMLDRGANKMLVYHDNLGFAESMISAGQIDMKWREGKL